METSGVQSREFDEGARAAREAQIRNGNVRCSESRSAKTTSRLASADQKWKRQVFRGWTVRNEPGETRRRSEMETSGVQRCPSAEFEPVPGRCRSEMETSGVQSSLSCSRRRKVTGADQKWKRQVFRARSMWDLPTSLGGADQKWKRQVFRGQTLDPRAPIRHVQIRNGNVRCSEPRRARMPRSWSRCADQKWKRQVFRVLNPGLGAAVGEMQIKDKSVRCSDTPTKTISWKRPPCRSDPNT